MENRPVRRRPRKHKKQLDKKVIWIASIAAAVVLILAVCLLWPKGDELPKAHDPERGPLKELTVGDMTRRGETMVVDTSYLPVEFPYAFSDLIKVKALNQGNQTALTFSALINGEEHELYTLWFNGTDGTAVGAFDLEDDEKPVVVTLAFYSPDAGVEGDDRTTFLATQETVNDVLQSMKQDAHFTSYE